MKKYIINLDKKFLLTVVAVSFIFLAYSIIVPVLQTPDESPHIRYIEFISENLRLPGKNEYSNGRTLNLSDFVLKLNQTQRGLMIVGNPNYHFPFGESSFPELQDMHLSYIFNHPPAYYLFGNIFWWLGGLFSSGFALLGLKVANYILLLIHLYYSYRVGKLFADRNDKAFPYILSLLSASWPMYLFLSTGANNDLLVVSASSGLFFYLVKVMKSSNLLIKDLAMMLVWLSIGVLTKAQFFVFIPLVALLILNHWKTLESRKNYKKLFVAFLPLLFPLVFFVNQFLQFGRIMPTPVDQSYDKILQSTSCAGLSVFHYIKTWLFPRVPMIAQSFIGNFGWLDTKAHREVILLAALIVLVSCLVFLVAFIKERQFRSKFKSFVLVAVPLALLLECLYSFLFFREYLERCYMFFPTQGRYYFLLLLPLSFAVLVGLKTLFSRFGNKFTYLLAILLIGLINSYSIVILIQRYYL